MRFDWAAYISLAEWLCRQASIEVDSEACYRAAVSRAYYGAFNLARQFAKERDGFECDSDEHRRLAEHFLRCGGERRGIGNRLASLRADRTKADYYDVLGEAPSAKASKALKWARQIERDLTTIGFA